MKAAVSDDQTVVAREAQRAEHEIEGLKANIAGLEAKLRETEDIVHRKEAASQKMEENLNAEIRDLQNVVRTKEEALERRESEINVLNSKIDVMAGQVSHLELAIEHARGEAASKNQQAEQVIDGLKTNISALEARLRETEDTIHKKDIASRKMEDSLAAEIRDLESLLKTKEEALQGRQSEVNDLKSKMDALVDQVTHLELTNGHAKETAASKAHQAEQVIEDLKMKIVTLQAQLSQTEQIVAGLVANGRVPDTESTIKQSCEDRNQDIDLDVHVEPHTNGIKHDTAAALIDIQAPQTSGTAGREPMETDVERSTSFEFQAIGATSTITEAASQTVSPYAFDRMIAEFSELSNVMRSIASLIVRDHVRAFGESMEEFPQERFPELVASLSKTISEEKLKTDFCQRFSKM
ncbi:MAG TPA: hypothetical protein VF182_01310 [Candidatus Binatia bacterium]